VNKKPHRPNAEGGAGRGKKQRMPIESALRELYVVIHFVARTAAGTWTTVLRFTRHEMKMFGQGEELTLIVPRTSWWALTQTFTVRVLFQTRSASSSSTSSSRIGSGIGIQFTFLVAASVAKIVNPAQFLNKGKTCAVVHTCAAR
jgi:hypothetical protein